MTGKLLKLFVILATSLCVGGLPRALSGGQESREYLIKAAFLYNFAKFVEWPAEAFDNDQAPIILCILGDDPFGPAIDAIRGKTVRGREMVVKRLPGAQDLEKCHILFISQSEEGEVGHIFSDLKDWHVLTVGDMDRFARLGGIINFITKENKIRFEVNVDTAEQSGLKISSKLLKLAKIVRQGMKGDSD